ncbi:MAG: AMP-binding protein [Rhodococcus sp. (in: high G+C Gram-positive bacteria)]|uniref:AMP-binding protein n=1 Tax=Rhodococcus sp. TaxID=1831 RepID=UPI002ADAFD56|nr:AMP-binding protein [Rhodococcus sp. (in: high G+C Gram-positive bacteria)]
MLSIHEVTQAQRGLIDAQTLAPNNPAFTIGEYIELRGTVDDDTFIAALAAMVSETDAERIRFVDTADGIKQTIHGDATGIVEYIDLSDYHAARDIALDQMNADLNVFRDLTADNLTRHVLYRIDQHECWWYHRTHHAALDGYSFALIARRVAELYSAARASRTPRELSRSRFADVLAEDQLYENSDRKTADRKFWVERLRGMDSIHSFSDTFALPAPTIHRVHATIDADQAELLTEAATAARVTWPEMILASVAVHLSRYTDSDTVVLGVPVMNRLGEVAFDIPCNHLNAIALPVQIMAEDTISVLAQRISLFLRESRPHQRYRYEHLRRDLGMLGGQRKLFGPVVNVMPFDYHLPIDDVETRVRNLTPGPVDDISFDVYHRGLDSSLEICVDANPRRYRLEEVESITRQFTRLLTEIIAAPHRLLARVGRSLHTLPEEPLTTQVQDCSLLIDTLAHTSPHAPAVTDPSSGRTWSRGELHAATSELAASLSALGIAGGHRVGFFPTRQGSDIIVVLALHHLGAAYVAFDNRGSSEALGRMIERSSADAILVDHTSTDATHSALLGTSLADKVILIDIARSAERGGDSAARNLPDNTPERHERDAYIVLTSGSGGEPKTVPISRPALAYFAASARQRYGISEADRVLQFGPLHADTSVEEIFVTLTVGATLVIAPDDSRKSLLDLLNLCLSESVTVLDLPTALWHELVLALDTGALQLPETIRIIIIGGEAVSAVRTRQWLKTPTQVRVLNTYGPSETTVAVTAHDLDTEKYAQFDSAPIGKPLPGMRAFVDYDNLSPDPDKGELIISGPTVARGYLGEVNSSGFSKLEIDNRPVHVFHTGDVVSVASDGSLRYHGRRDDQVKIAGYRISLRGIEEHLRAHPGVDDASVTANAGPQISATIAVTVVSQLPTAEIRKAIDPHIPAHAVGLTITNTPELPRTKSGKIQKAAPLPPTPRARNEGRDVATATRVAEVWKEVLALPTIDHAADFFDLGGGSLHTVVVANRLSIAFGFDVPVDLVFAYPTVASLADAITNTIDQAATTRRTTAVSTRIGEDLSSLSKVISLQQWTGGAPTRRKVLLTGATGYIGSHVLGSFLRTTGLQIVLLTREKEHADAELRIAERLGIASEADRDRFHRLVRARVSMVSGDLALPDLGLTGAEWDSLAADVTDIVNCAAVVSALRTYESLRQVNVVAVASLLRLSATARTANFHQISTVGASPSPQTAQRLADPATFADGYRASKSVAEHLVSNILGPRGSAASVIRLGRVLGPRAGGPRNQHDPLLAVLEASSAIGAFPDVDLVEPLSCVDDVADRIVDLVVRQQRGFRVVEVGPSTCSEFVDVVDGLHPDGTRIEWIALPEWTSKVADSQYLTQEKKSLLTAWARVVEGAPEREVVNSVDDSDATADYRVLTPEVEPPLMRRLLADSGARW